jgi:hypothetical protein
MHDQEQALHIGGEIYACHTRVGQGGGDLVAGSLFGILFD